MNKPLQWPTFCQGELHSAIYFPRNDVCFGLWESTREADSVSFDDQQSVISFKSFKRLRFTLRCLQNRPQLLCSDALCKHWTPWPSPTQPASPCETTVVELMIPTAVVVVRPQSGLPSYISHMIFTWWLIHVIHIHRERQCMHSSLLLNIQITVKKKKKPNMLVDCASILCSGVTWWWQSCSVPAGSISLNCHGYLYHDRDSFEEMFPLNACSLLTPCKPCKGNFCRIKRNIVEDIPPTLKLT